MTAAITAGANQSASHRADRNRPEQQMSLATMMVYVDVEHDCEQRVQLALGLADRFQATLIGVAGLALRPAFSAGSVVVYAEPTQDDLKTVTSRLDVVGKKFRAQGQCLKQIEWRSALEFPNELISRKARAADLVIVGSRQPDGHSFVDPGVILLGAGRPVMVVPEIVPPLLLHRVVVAWKDTRESRRAVRDALPLLQEAKEVLLVEIGEDASKSGAKKTLADVADYLVRHRVIVADRIWRRARGPAATELLNVVRDEKADLIVAGGYGHSRLGEWVFGGVTHALLASSSVCCMLSH
jgi:nucleotide-binding universal stress UspA family protein